jgi:hypothetical protein
MRHKLAEGLLHVLQEWMLKAVNEQVELGEVESDAEKHKRQKHTPDVKKARG